MNDSNQSQYAANEFVFVRARVMRYAPTVASMKGAGEWMIVPIDSSGNDVPNGGVLFVGAPSLVSIAEAKKIVRNA